LCLSCVQMLLIAADDTRTASSKRVCTSAATFHPASGSSPFSPSPSSAPCAANCAGTCRLRSSSGDLTNSSPASSGSEAGSLLAPHGRPQRYFSQLVAKNRSEPHYSYEKLSWRSWRPELSVLLLSQDAAFGSHQGGVKQGPHAFRLLIPSPGHSGVSCTAYNHGVTCCGFIFESLRTKPAQDVAYLGNPRTASVVGFSFLC
jgi:hypothetical protein